MTKLLNIALSQYGIMEIKGSADNPEITKYFDALGFDGAALKDETSWCSAFINYCAKCAELPHSGKLDARGWLEIGNEVCHGEHQLGDVVVFWRGEHANDLIAGTNVKKGHVALYIREDENFTWCLGGNQNNMVCISPYPKHKVLGYRRLQS